MIANVNKCYRRVINKCRTDYQVPDMASSLWNSSYIKCKFRRFGKKTKTVKRPSWMQKCIFLKN